MIAKTLEDFNLKLVYRPLKKELGYFDEKTNEIVISSKISDFNKDAIFIHEILHVVASQLKQMGIIKKQPDHKFITNCSQQLLALFVVSGKWNKKYKIKLK